jgi:putative ABC transport system ATP-binding protein
MGPSGSGKTTLLNCLSGLDDIDGGTVWVDGQAINELSDAARTRHRAESMGFVFQAFNLIPTLTAQENVEVPLFVGDHPGSPAARAREMLALVGLEHRTRHRPSQLSGGEQQRVAIARAMATRPAIVIADEPTGNLDAATGERILQLIAEIREQSGTTFVIATHDPAIARRAERVLTIVDGRLTAETTVGR